jgi:nitroimidazol reductase NimA-like FMN-containing flavoprotein (pyridoxamine 5'-phosphate oxidase superfamily)
MLVRLSEDESDSMLKAAGVARLGCIVDGGPYIVPINYYFENGCAYSHSLPGLKISALRENPRACLQVDDIESDLRWRSVLAFGKFEEIASASERGNILGKILNRFPILTPVEIAITRDAGPPSIIVFRIRIDKMTGVGEE